MADVDEDGDVLRTYTAGSGIDNWLSFSDHQTTNTYYYITDHVGTVHAVTDELGAVVESYRYSPYGKVLDVFDENGNTISESAIGNRILFQGREYDWDTGFYYFRARWFDPDTGRWLSKDPVGINGGLNQYVFCGNNPVMFVDPLGLTVASIEISSAMAACGPAGNISASIVWDSNGEAGLFLKGGYGTGAGLFTSSGLAKNALLKLGLKALDLVIEQSNTVYFSDRNKELSSIWDLTIERELTRYGGFFVMGEWDYDSELTGLGFGVGGTAMWESSLLIPFPQWLENLFPKLKKCGD